jgi:phosphoribosylaminoimidazole-succinocarboxamide synthase
MEPGRLDDTLRAQLRRTLTSTDFPSLGEKYAGKVRDNYSRDGKRTIVVTDRLSTFDVIVGTIPFKGQVLNQMAEYWFRETADIAPSHFFSAPDPNVMVVQECEPLKTEFVMRAYLTGVTTTSIWYAYARGAREFCGHPLPDGMTQHQRLPEPLLTPSTKAEKGGHDISISREQLVEQGSISAEHFDRCASIAQALFDFGQKRAAERGLILVDTKYEMGIAPSGEILVIDEIHTPDSSRYWFADDYETRMAAGEPPRSLDKEFVRRWFVEEHGYSGDGEPPPLTDEIRVEAAKRYIATYELIAGREFAPDTADPVPRIAENLGL